MFIELFKNQLQTRLETGTSFFLWKKMYKMQRHFVSDKFATANLQMPIVRNDSNNWDPKL